MPVIASDGIQVMDVTDFSTRIRASPSLPVDGVQAKLNRPARPV
jgi:hypothetical protein